MAILTQASVAISILVCSTVMPLMILIAILLSLPFRSLSVKRPVLGGVAVDDALKLALAKSLETLRPHEEHLLDLLNVTGGSSHSWNGSSSGTAASGNSGGAPRGRPPAFCLGLPGSSGDHCLGSA